MAETHDHTGENSMSDANNGCEGSAMFSRRGFLKGVGALALGTAAARVAIAPGVAEAAANTKRDLQRILKLTASSPLFQQAVKELRSQGFKFALGKSYDPASALRSDSTPHLVGLPLPVVQSPDPAHLAAKLIVTADLNAGVLVAIAYAFIWTDEDVVEIDDIVLLDDGRRVEKHHKVNVSEGADPALSPAAEKQVTYLPGRPTGRNQRVMAATECTCSTWVTDPYTCCRWEMCVYPTYKCVSFRQYRSCSGDCAGIATTRCIEYGCV